MSCGSRKPVNAPYEQYRSLKRFYRNLLIEVAIAAALFLFLVPVIYVQPQGYYLCPVNGCNFARYGSVTYWACKVGGAWMDRGYYTILF